MAGFVASAAGVSQPVRAGPRRADGGSADSLRREFRLRGSVLFLTFPRCDGEPGALLGHVRSVLGSRYVGARVARELHADGGKHLHALVATTGFDSRDHRVFDFGGFHGNYAVARSVRSSFEYVSKDGDFVDDGDISDLARGDRPRADSAKRSVAASVAERVKEGATLAELVEEFPSYVLQNKRRVEEFISLMRELRTQAVIWRWDASVVTVGVEEAVQDSSITLTVGETRVLSWLVKNLTGIRPFKQPQLYVQSPANFGKTSLVMILAKCFRIYHAPLEEKFFDQFDDGIHSLVVFDEFFGQHKITFMNCFLQGGPMTLGRKGSQFLKTVNVPVIILSNCRLDELYRNCPVLAKDAFAARLEVCELDAPLFSLNSILTQILED